MPDNSNNQQWLLFLPQLPSSPSSLRVLVWRRLRTSGATALQNGVWVLPNTPESEQLLRDLLKEINFQSGSGYLLTASPLDAVQNEEILERFRSDRDLEYGEFCERCSDFLSEIKKETILKKFTFAELEENEDDLHKLTGWIRKIRTRDFFKGHQAPRAATMLTECQEALKNFATAVYIREGLTSESPGNSNSTSNDNGNSEGNESGSSQEQKPSTPID